MKTLVCLAIIALLPLVFTSNEYRRTSNGDSRHLNSIAFDGTTFGGCRKKHPENRSLPGGAEACASHKPLKIKGIEKVGKRLCADGYEYCSVAHKSLHRLSWKTKSMPKFCFGFHYRKDKFAGYGHNCHRNLYFDGLLCCPSDGHKSNHNLKISNKLHHRRHLKSSDNYLKK